MHKKPVQHIQEPLSAELRTAERWAELEARNKVLEQSIQLSKQEVLRMKEAVHDQNAELQSLFRAAAFLNSNQSAENIFENLAREAVVATDFPMAWIEFIGENESYIELQAVHGVPNPSMYLSRSRLGTSICYFEKFIDGESVYENGALTHSTEHGDICRDMRIASLISVPLRTPRGLVGAISLGHTQANKCSERITNYLITLAAQVAAGHERQRLHQKSLLQQASVVAQSKMSELGKMAGGLAHEINTPLNVMMLLVDELSERAESRKLVDFKEPLETIMSTVVRIAAIVKGLRTFSRDSSADPFHSANLNQVLQETLAFCNSRLQYNFVKLHIECRADLKIECRASQLSQAILNLLSNALDAVGELDDKWINIEVFDLDEFIQIAVTDSGRGIPAEIHEKLMQPFFTTKELGSGTGLGLSISSGIAKAHGGSLYLDPDSANTRFVLTLAKKPVTVIKSAA